MKSMSEKTVLLETIKGNFYRVFMLFCIDIGQGWLGCTVRTFYSRFMYYVRCRLTRSIYNTSVTHIYHAQANPFKANQFIIDTTLISCLLISALGSVASTTHGKWRAHCFH